MERVGATGHVSGHDDLINDPISDLFAAIRLRPTARYDQLAGELGVSEATVKRHIRKLKDAGRIRRVGSRKTGYWEVL